jgi:hypothetical protein
MLGWYQYTDPVGNIYNVTCQAATISCPNTDNWGVTLGYLDPAGKVPNTSQTRGTIIFFTGDGGGVSQLPGTLGYADAYFKAGYEIVQVAWSGDWEYSYSSFGSGRVANIQNAACRPAVILNHVYNQVFKNLPHPASNAGYCSHGASAGSAQIAYSLAYYGAGSLLDNVELISGPVFSDIKQGCEVPAPSNVTICGGGQYGCKLGSGGSWSLSPSYVGVQGMVGQWTNDNSCRGQQNTSGASNAAWLAQSIVDQSTGGSGQPPVPTFTYSSTAMSAWLCRTVVNNMTNNSSPQGQIFYAQIGAGNSPPSYAVYAVDTCPDAENVGGGTVPGFAISGLQGSRAVVDDMVGYSINGNNVAAKCSHPQ